jgi:hypothetical protein
MNVQDAKSDSLSPGASAAFSYKGPAVAGLLSPVASIKTAACVVLRTKGSAVLIATPKLPDCTDDAPVQTSVGEDENEYRWVRRETLTDIVSCACLTCNAEVISS